MGPTSSRSMGASTTSTSCASTWIATSAPWRRRRGLEEQRRHSRQYHQPVPLAPRSGTIWGHRAVPILRTRGALGLERGVPRVLPRRQGRGARVLRQPPAWGYDLADKELAVLIAEVARNEAHVAVLFDCCHSGSGTRDVTSARGLKPRLTHEVTTERPLETYLDGYYSRLRDAGQPLFVPTARHILLAACERGQLAQEMPGHGLFTSTLIDVLEKSGGELSYADLSCAAAPRSDRERSIRIRSSRPTTGSTLVQGSSGDPWLARLVVDTWSPAIRGVDRRMRGGQRGTQPSGTSLSPWHCIRRPTDDSGRHRASSAGRAAEEGDELDFDSARISALRRRDHQPASGTDARGLRR